MFFRQKRPRRSKDEKFRKFNLEDRQGREKKNSARKREVKNFFFGEQSDQIFVGASKWFLTHVAKFDNSHGDH